ncbi:MAG: HYR domain-containing protein, partial [Blastocatellia bacterium]
NIAVAINDNSSVDVPITVSDTGVVQDVNVRVRLDHTFDADLDISLVAPNGTIVNLSSGNGGGNDNYGSGTNNCSGTPTVFDDSAATAITAGTAPFAGTFRPEQVLSTVNGLNVNGIWKLRVADTASLDVGTIGCVTLEITRAAYVCCTGPVSCTLTCPANITVPNTTGQCSAAVTYSAPTTSGTCGTVTCSPASGSTFAVGTTTVSCSSATGGGACSFTVTVQDTQAPTITCPANHTANGSGPTVVNYPAPTVGDNCPGVGAPNCVPASGSSFPLGTTTVTCSVSDASPNSPDATCTFTVTVVTCTITCPANQVAWTAGTSATVTYPAPTTTGSCGTVTCVPASGSSFNVGTTTVSCSTTAGPSCSFTVTVNRLTLGSVLADPLACSGPGNKVNGSFSATNNSGASASVSVSATLSNLVYLPLTASASQPGAIVVLSNVISWTGTLGAGQTVTVSYMAQIADNAAPGTQACSVTTAVVNGINVQGNATACLTVNCPPVGPGSIFPATSEASDQAAGSVLIYNIYTSGATSGNTQNTRVNITNVHPLLPAFVHLFFVSEGCSVADSYICLTGNQTSSFLASDLDPGVTGYIVAVAVDGVRGCPTNFNFLIGDEYVKFTTGHAANLGAEAISALAGGLPACDGNSVTAQLNFDGISYDLVSHVLADDNVGSRADGNDTLLILNRIGGNLGTGAGSLSSVFGIFYDDAENALSFTFNGGHQFRSSLSNNFPRLTPRFETFIPAGRTGWFKLWPTTGLWGMTGAAINFNPNAASSSGAFNHGHNLHKLRLTNTANYVIPIFPPSC